MKILTLILQIVATILLHRHDPVIAAERAAETALENMNERIAEAEDAIEDEDAERLDDAIRGVVNARIRSRLSESEREDRLAGRSN
jgi:hypothetical protein